MRTPYPNELYHHGIKGQKWGVRRYQNPDGSLTPAGKKKYYKQDGKTLTRAGKRWDKKEKEKEFEAAKTKHLTMRKKVESARDDLHDEFDNTEHGKKLKKTMNDAEDAFYEYSGPYGKEYDRLSSNFTKAEAAYLKSAYKYVGNELQRKFGNDELKKYEIEYMTRKYDKHKLGARDPSSEMRGKTYAEWYANTWKLHTS